MGQGYSQNHRGMMGYGQYHRGMGYGNSEFRYGVGPGALLRDEMNEARVSVLAELSGKAVEDIQEQVKTKPFRMLLDEYQVNPEEFQAKMHAKVVLLVDQAAKAGKITEEQAKTMYERMNAMGQNSFARGPHWGSEFR